VRRAQHIKTRGAPHHKTRQNKERRPHQSKHRSAGRLSPPHTHTEPRIGLGRATASAGLGMPRFALYVLDPIDFYCRVYGSSFLLLLLPLLASVRHCV
jgi:hypothetical protein